MLFRRPAAPLPLLVPPKLPEPADTTGLDRCPRDDCDNWVTEPFFWVARGQSYCSQICGNRAAAHEPPQIRWPE